MAHNRPRILIADDHIFVAEACKNLLESEYDIVGIVSDGRALLQTARELQPDVVLVDIAMPQLNGLDAAEQIRNQNRGTKLIFLTMTAAPEVAAEAFRRGASGYVVKQCSAEELVIAVRRVMRGQSYLSPMITRETVDFLLRSGNQLWNQKKISPRQREVVQLLAEGNSMKQVAYILRLKPGTIAFHKYKAMEALNVRSNAELMEYAIRNQLLVGSQDS